MSLRDQLQALESWGLIQMLDTQPETEYLFRHALLQDAAYDTLLNQDRVQLHRLVGQAIERIYPDHIDEYAALLAYHFDRAGDSGRALHYYVLAGETAYQQFANSVAVRHYTRAIELAERGTDDKLLSKLLRARGQAHEFLGDFEEARADYQAALKASRASGKRREQWTVLTHLGSLWTSRDYTESDKYYHHALDLAREMNDPAILARSLNLVGNWHLNVEEPDEALRHHEEALTLYKNSKDKRGIASTFDLLGMTNFISSQLPQGAYYCKHANRLYRELKDRKGIINSLSPLTLCGGSYLGNTVVPAGARLGEFLSEGEMALKLSQEIGWRSAEAFNLIVIGSCLIPLGDYKRALGCTQTALDIAQEIEHRQWITAAQCALGALYLSILALPVARQHVEKALKMAYQIDSLNWIRVASGQLASICILQRDLTWAQTALDSALETGTKAQTVGQRMCWSGRVELALANDDPNLALQLTHKLISSATNVTHEGAIPRLWQLRGEALAALNRTDEAEADLQAARAGALAQGARGRLWRVQTALGRLYRSQARDEDAQKEFSAAQEIITELAAQIEDKSLCDNFTRRAHAMQKNSPWSDKAHAD